MIPTAPPPTHDQALERIVLGSLMHAAQTTETAHEALALLEERDFYFHAHRDTFVAIHKLLERGEQPDAVTVSDELASGDYKRIETHDPTEIRIAVYTYTEEVPLVSNAVTYARDLHNLGLRRRVQNAAQRVVHANGSLPFDVEQLRAAIDATAAAAGGKSRLEPVPWTTFREHVSDHVEWLVDGIWPEGLTGVIAGAQKAHKTWLGLDLAVSVALGHPYLGAYHVRQPRTVIYVALEGHAANIKTRIGCLTRGRGLDPDHHPERLHIIWKPPGIDLLDATWVADLTQRAEALDASLIVVDVLRQAASVEENSNTDIAKLFRTLKPLEQRGTAVALLHHFAKMSEQLRARSPIERTSGAGAIGGSVDVGIYITSPPEAPLIRVQIVSRNDASPPPFGIAFEGHPSGERGSYRYTDELRLRVQSETPDEDDVKAPAREIAQFVKDAPGGKRSVTEVKNAFNVSRQTLLRRRESTPRYGVVYIADGKESYFLYDPRFDPDNTAPDRAFQRSTCVPWNAAETERSAFHHSVPPVGCEPVERCAPPPNGQLIDPDDAPIVARPAK